MTIISGGQTGTDRAALDWAIARGVPHGGWCPKGRWAEDGPIAARYQLRETPSSDPAQRTEWNVRDSDATVIFSIKEELSGGTLLAAQFARQYQKPLLHICIERTTDYTDERRCLEEPRQSTKSAAATQISHFLSFLRWHRIKTLHIAGPRASEEPEVGRFVTEVLEGLDG